MLAHLLINQIWTTNCRWVCLQGRAGLIEVSNGEFSSFVAVEITNHHEQDKHRLDVFL